MWTNPQKTGTLFISTKEILIGQLHFFFAEPFIIGMIVSSDCVTIVQINVNSLFYCSTWNIYKKSIPPKFKLKREEYDRFSFEKITENIFGSLCILVRCYMDYLFVLCFRSLGEYWFIILSKQRCKRFSSQLSSSAQAWIPCHWCNWHWSKHFLF